MPKEQANQKIRNPKKEMPKKGKKTRVWKTGPKNNFVKQLTRNTERRKIKQPRLTRFAMNSSRLLRLKSKIIKPLSNIYGI